jgi:hypothetical protein
MIKIKWQNKRRIAAAFGGLVVMAILLLVAHHQHTWPFHKVVPDYTTTAHTTSTAKSAQDNFGGDNQKIVPATTPIASVNVSDQNGSISQSIPPSSQWSTSQDKTSLVVYSPSQNSLFSSGSVVFGTAAEASTVSYRLTDSVSGVITTGTANVVDRKFSIKFSFSTTADRGNIEIFNQATPNSPESNNVLIPVRFK